MKTQLFTLITLILLFFANFSYSQITVTSSDFFKVGDYYPVTVSNSLTTNATSGANKTWNYTYLDTLNYRGNDRYSLPSTTKHGTHFPTSNIAGYTVGDTIGISYYLKTNNKLEQVGYYSGSGVKQIYSNPLTVYEFPLVYNNQNSDKFAYEYTIPSSWHGLSSDSLRFIITGKKNYRVDSWGSLTLPSGTFNALRIRDTSIYESEIKELDAGVWSTINMSQDTFYSNSFVSNNPHAKNDLLTQHLDKNGIVTYNFWSDVTPGFVSIEEKQKSFKFSIYPNPADDFITINSEIEITSFAIKNISGQIIAQNNFKNQKQIDISQLSSGIYFLSLKSENVESTQKFIKK